jgi:hypothetical protein
VGPRACLDTEARGKILSPAGDRTPIARSSSPYSDTILTELPGSSTVKVDDITISFMTALFMLVAVRNSYLTYPMLVSISDAMDDCIFSSYIKKCD